MNGFIIPEKLPGLNDYIHAINRNKFIGNRLKRDVQDKIGLYILSAARGGKLSPVAVYPVTVAFEWHETNMRRDLDNITSAKKFILDALQEYGILKGDGQKYVSGIPDSFCIPSSYDGVKITLCEYRREDKAK
ncbi:MAG: hypothetical protein ACI4RV_06475 [Eubacteriales bacterium]